MSNYINLFVGGRDQFVTLMATFFVVLVLSSLGGVLAGRRRDFEIDFVLGWGALTFIFTITAVFFEAPLKMVSWATIIAAPVGLIVLYMRDKRVLAPGSFHLIVLGIPLLLVASTMIPSQWDEFSHWLPASRFLFLTNDIPSQNNPVIGTQMLPAYPFGWPYLTYVASLISGKFLESSGRIFNLILLFSFGLLAVKVAAKTAGYGEKKTFGWKLSGLAIAFVTLFNPTFVQKIIFTAYAEVSTAVVLGFITYLYWVLLKDQTSKNKKNIWLATWQVALAGIALVNIKQVNIILFGSLSLMYLLVAWRDQNIQTNQAFALATCIFVPTAVIYAIWRYHVGTNFGMDAGAEAQWQPIASWHIDKMHLIFLQMLAIALKKIAFFGIMTISAVLGIRALFKIQNSYDRLVILIGGTFLLYNGFLFFTYIASFGEQAALSAVSFWRYNTHLGMLAVLFFAASSGLLWQKFNLLKNKLQSLAFLPLILVVITPFIFIHKLRFDLEPDKPHFTNVAIALRSIISDDIPLAFIDPQGTGESAVIARYVTNRYTIPYLSAFHGPTYKKIKHLITQESQHKWVLIHSVIPAVRKYFALNLKDDVSYLVHKKSDKWEIVQEWPYPKTL